MSQFEIITSASRPSKPHVGQLGYEVPLPTLPEGVATGQVAPDISKFLDAGRLVVTPHDIPEAISLALELGICLESAQFGNMPSIIERLRAIQAPETVTSCGENQWDALLDPRPSDLGGEPIRERLLDLFTKYNGRILEAMCGYSSFFKPRDSIEVIAMDNSRRGLELYEYPERERILFDLDSLKSGDRLPFAKDGSLDVVSISYGFKYPKDIVVVLEAFRRSLAPGGTIVFVESSASGYSHLTKRGFTPESCEKYLRQAGFSDVNTSKIASTGSHFAYQTHHYLVEAR